MQTNDSAYHLYGQGKNVLVFIHGVGMNQHVWQSQVNFFSHQYRVLVYDILGHGQSPCPAENPELSDYVEQLETLLNELEIDKIVLIGHSMGALVGVAFALKHTDRVTDLIAMNIAYQRSHTQRKAVIKRADQVLQYKRITGIEKKLKYWFNNKTDTKSIEKIDLVRQWLNQADPLGYGRTYRLFAVSDREFCGKLEKLKIPVLYLTGSEDLNSSKYMSQQIARETPFGRAQVIEGEAHMMAYISADKINPVIKEFITLKKPVGSSITR